GGGMHWGGVSHDPARHLVIVNTNRLAFALTLVPRARYEAERAAAAGNPWREISPQRGTPYGMHRQPILPPLGVPCNPPPWGTLAAVDLVTGDVRWEVPLGISPEVGGVPAASAWGSYNYGGTLTTAGGLIFAAAARDTALRAFDVETGQVIWSAPLPASAQATPMTYRSPSGRRGAPARGARSGATMWWPSRSPERAAASRAQRRAASSASRARTPEARSRTHGARQWGEAECLAQLATRIGAYGFWKGFGIRLTSRNWEDR